MGSLRVDDQGSALLELADTNGKRRFAAGASANEDDESSLRLYSANGEAAIAMGAFEQIGGGFLHVLNSQGTRVISAITESDGGGRFDLAGSNGGAVYSVDAIQDSGAAMALMNSAGTKLFLVGTSKAGGLMNIMNNKGQAIVICGAAGEGFGGAITVRNQDGKQVIESGVDDQGGGIISVWDAKGERRKTVSSR